MKNIITITNVMKKYHMPNVDLIERAYKISKMYHGSQKRRSGEEYIVHPVQVACILASWRMESDVVAAGLLHDVIEDSNGAYTKEDMQRDFGPRITNLVDGVTKVKKNKQETYNKMLTCLKEDQMVAYIKLADRIHNMETLQFLDPEKRERIAEETLRVYIPLAQFLGAYRIQRNLQNSWLLQTRPEVYKSTESKYKSYMQNKKEEADKLISQMRTVFFQNSNAEVIFKERDIYGFYYQYEDDKTKDKVTETHDLYIIFPDEDEGNMDIVDKCSEILSDNFANLRDVKNSHRNYIKNPKKNGYKSFHMTLKDTKTHIYFRVFIRTESMHNDAERGRLENISDFMNLPVNLEGVSSQEEAVEAIELGFTEEKVIIYTEKNDTILMKKGATVLDFAYEIHSEIGMHATGAVINGSKQVGIHSILKSGYVVKVLTDLSVYPEFGWIKYANTSNAKRKLMEFFQERYAN